MLIHHELVAGDRSNHNGYEHIDPWLHELTFLQVKATALAMAKMPTDIATYKVLLRKNQGATLRYGYFHSLILLSYLFF
jgi:hypothetical protein